MDSPKIREAPTSPSAAGRGVVTAHQRRIEAGLCISCRKLARPDRLTRAGCGRADSDRRRQQYRAR